MITAVRTALTKLGYKVWNKRMNKVGPNELVVIVDDVDIQQLDTMAYKATVWMLVEWDTESGDGIPEQIVNLVHNIEQEVVYNTSTDCKATFKCRQSQVNLLGTLYRVSVILEYVDEILIEGD